MDDRIVMHVLRAKSTFKIGAFTVREGMFFGLTEDGVTVAFSGLCCGYAIYAYFLHDTKTITKLWLSFEEVEIYLYGYEGDFVLALWQDEELNYDDDDVAYELFKLSDFKLLAHLYDMPTYTTSGGLWFTTKKGKLYEYCQGIIRYLNRDCEWVIVNNICNAI